MGEWEDSRPRDLQNLLETVLIEMVLTMSHQQKEEGEDQDLIQCLEVVDMGQEEDSVADMGEGEDIEVAREEATADQVDLEAAVEAGEVVAEVLEEVAADI